jgi:hypothetical protein
MAHSSLKVSESVAKKLRAAKLAGETVGDVINRLLDDVPVAAKTVEGWLESLAPPEGVGVFTPEGRKQLMRDQRAPRDSFTRRMGSSRRRSVN